MNLTSLPAGLLAGGHPLPSLRPHKHRSCISRSAVMDEHPRLALQNWERQELAAFEIIFAAKSWASPVGPLRCAPRQCIPERFLASNTPSITLVTCTSAPLTSTARAGENLWEKVE